MDFHGLNIVIKASVTLSQEEVSFLDSLEESYTVPWIQEVAGHGTSAMLDEEELQELIKMTSQERISKAKVLHTAFTSALATLQERRQDLGLK